jgi:lipopolysaccharide cholinephosphotransferase
MKQTKKIEGDGITLSPHDMEQLHAILLEMLIEVDRICRKIGIRYCIIAGTLLGAVRHGGFIPWDDDLDVAFMRSEYDRFRDACERDLDAERFFFQDHTTDVQYRWGYGRIRRKNSEFVRVGQEHMKMRTGIFIDIFPLDAVPDAWLLRRVHGFCCFVLRKLLYAEAGTVAGRTAILRAWFRFLNRIPHAFVLRCTEALAARCNRDATELVRIYTFPTPKGTYGYYRMWYEDLSKIAFETGCFFGIKDYDGYLRYKFGDYMQLPPESQRRRHSASKFSLPD